MTEYERQLMGAMLAGTFAQSQGGGSSDMNRWLLEAARISQQPMGGRSTAAPGMPIQPMGQGQGLMPK